MSMPPMVRYTRDAVLNAAYELIRRSGFSALNARSVAQELGSSTQPIFRLFSGMEELREGVVELAVEAMQRYMREAVRGSDTPYLTLGLAYVHFARDEAELFKMLFMSDRNVDVDQMFPVPDELIALVQEASGLSAIHARLLHSWLWVFTHGLAVSFATKMCCISEERLPKVLEGAYEAAALKMKQDIAAGLA